jgi:hypothetical protein
MDATDPQRNAVRPSRRARTPRTPKPPRRQDRQETCGTPETPETWTAVLLSRVTMSAVQASRGRVPDGVLRRSPSLAAGGAHRRPLAHRGRAEFCSAPGGGATQNELSTPLRDPGEETKDERPKGRGQIRERRGPLTRILGLGSSGVSVRAVVRGPVEDGRLAGRRAERRQKPRSGHDPLQVLCAKRRW